MQRIAQRSMRILGGADIEPGAVLGERLLIPHPVGLVIGNGVTVKDDVYLGSGVVLGFRMNRVAAGDGHPVIESGAWIGAHAVVLGPVNVGAGAIVAANSVVVEDVKPGWLVAGSPARHVKIVRSL